VLLARLMLPGACIQPFEHQQNGMHHPQVNYPEKGEKKTGLNKGNALKLVDKQQAKSKVCMSATLAP
jgi:hypothetical protein